MTLEPDAVARELCARVRGRVARDEPLGPFTTYRVGGPADVYVEAASIDDLVAVAEVVRGTMPVAVVGRGSNMLVSDGGFRGIAVRLGRQFRVHERAGDGVRFGGAVYLPAAAKLTARHGLAGFEFAAEIPATFGGAVRMNAGAHDGCMADVLRWTRTVDVHTGAVQRLAVQDLGYGYRHSCLRPTQVVVEGEVGLRPDDPAEVSARISAHLSWRRTHQPPGRSVGSVFKNPPDDSAGRLVDAAGLKGAREGDAEVSAVHANFIVAGRDATAADVWRLIWRVWSAVREVHGVELEPEVRFLGEFPQVESPPQGELHS